MKRLLILIAALTLLVLAVSACSQDQRAVLQTAVAVPGGGNAIAQEPTPVASAGATATPEFSVLASPTPQPTLAGPMGTLTAIADLVASPTQDTEPYVIENTGNPHFIEFHAWW